MNTEQKLSGVWVPVLTPFLHDLEPNEPAFVQHCRWLLGQGADGLAVFGTTSEANSLSLEERIRLHTSAIVSTRDRYRYTGHTQGRLLF